MKSRWTISPCPKCGKPERHDVSRNLKLCAICFMMAADAVDRKEKHASQVYDWKKTFDRIKQVWGHSNKDLALTLKLPVRRIHEVKTGKVIISTELLEKIKEKYESCLVQAA